MLFKDEILVLPRPAVQAAEFQVSWAYPNQYSVGMAGLGYQLIWWLLENQPGVEVKRVFTDLKQSRWQLSELIGFTLSWELDYVNVLQLLNEAGIPLLSQSRTGEQAIVFGGGPALTANPEPFADFFDVILLGDAEQTIPALIEGWKQARQLSNRAAQLEHLASIDGLYVPSLYRYEYEADAEEGPLSAVTPADPAIPASRCRLAFMPPPDYVAHSVILSPGAAWADRFLVEVVRSCPQECRFCLASYLTRPFRSTPVETLLSRIDLGLSYTKKIGLLGPSVTEHPQFGLIAAELIKRSETEISIASIRMDTVEPAVLEMLVALGQRSVTVALESGSERLRAIMKKNLSDDDIYRSVDGIAASGLSGVKFYGMVGLPEERQEDLDATVSLLTALKKRHRQLGITLGVSSFVPKAQTPFQWWGRDRNSAKKQEFLRKQLSRLGINVRPESSNWSDIQALLSRGDRRLTPVLLSAFHHGGNLGAWKRALRNPPEGCPPADFYIFRNIPHQEFLPWSHLMDEARASMLARHDLSARTLATA